MRIKRFILTTITILLLLPAMQANSISPRMACEGKKKGDPCNQGYGCSSSSKCVASPTLHPDDKKAGKTESLECSK